jgi:hypothetical protein
MTDNPPTKEQIEAFRKRLEKLPLPTTIDLYEELGREERAKKLGRG